MGGDNILGLGVGGEERALYELQWSPVLSLIYPLGPRLRENNYSTVFSARQTHVLFPTRALGRGLWDSCSELLLRHCSMPTDGLGWTSYVGDCSPEAISGLLCCWRAMELQHHTELGLLGLNEEGVPSIWEASASQLFQYWDDNCLAIWVITMCGNICALWKCFLMHPLVSSYATQ